MAGGKAAPEFYPLYRLTNNKTGAAVEARGLTNVMIAAGLKPKTTATRLRASKKWKLEQIGDPEIWNESAYRKGLYKKTAHRYQTYEARKFMRDPLFQRRKQLRLYKWRNLDGSRFTAEQHELMLQQPCAICGKFGRQIGVDHDHKTNIVRDSLCRTCNLAIGHAQDSIDLLLKMAEYLKKT